MAATPTWRPPVRWCESCGDGRRWRATAPVTAERRFARDWYLLVVSFRHGRAEVGWSRAYLAEARELFPKDPQVLLVTGSDHEMVSHVTAGYLRRFSANGQSFNESKINPEKELEEAETYFKQAAALAPDLVEARLRLGRVLMRRGDLDGADARASGGTRRHDQVQPIRSDISPGCFSAWSTSTAATWRAQRNPIWRHCGCFREPRRSRSR